MNRTAQNQKCHCSRSTDRNQTAVSVERTHRQGELGTRPVGKGKTEDDVFKTKVSRTQSGGRHIKWSTTRCKAGNNHDVIMENGRGREKKQRVPNYTRPCWVQISNPMEMEWNVLNKRKGSKGNSLRFLATVLSSRKYLPRLLYSNKV